jgi:hypothetical protein
MPGSVGYAAVGSPARVLPYGLCRSFAHRREVAIQANVYRGGESQVGLLVTAQSFRCYWSQSRRLSPDDIATLRSFFATCSGPYLAFYFYDTANEKAAVYDATGAATTGRYTVRFEGAWSESREIYRGVVPVSLVQVI